MALALPGAEEGRHQGHADFRVGGKIFATLGYPDDAWGMIKLPPSEQARLVKEHPAAFKPAAGAWGARGSTLVLIGRVTDRTLRPAMALAWQSCRPVPAKRGRSAHPAGGVFEDHVR